MYWIMHTSLRCHLPQHGCVLHELLPELYRIVFLLHFWRLFLNWILPFELLLLHLRYCLELVMLFVAEARDGGGVVGGDRPPEFGVWGLVSVLVHYIVQ